ncbi:MAG: penicillin-binding protein 1A [Candidatus Binatia bacterium]
MANETAPASQAPSRAGRIRRFFRFFFRSIALIVLIGTAIAAWVFYQDLTEELPSIERLARYAPPAVTRVYAGDGTTLLGEFYMQKRYPLPLNKIPILVQRAFLAAEDKDFYQHHGVNFSAIVRALISNWNEGRTVQGGSTITQQIVKSVLLTPERTYRRKLQEMILALRLERKLTKEQILELYLNQIYLGSGAYGVEAAAREYFNKGVNDLTLQEMTLIAGLAPAPSVYNPFKNLEGAKQRQRYVLERMMEERYISYAQGMTAWQEQISPLQQPPPSYSDLAPYYVEHVRQILERRYGEDAAETLGLNIYTTVDLNLQKIAEKNFRKGIDTLCQRGGICRSKTGNRLDGGLLAVDLTTGEVKAMVGGYDFNRSQYNRATQSKRQPGSAFKPIVYAAALDNGFTPASIVKDSPVSYRDGRGKRWSPKNADRKYRGAMRLREALTFSRNVPTVRLADQIGIPYLISYATKVGIKTPLAPNLSLALGSSEVTLLDLIRAYGAFATGGKAFDPIFISKITDSHGALVSEANFSPAQIISPETAYLVTSMLKSVIERGTGKTALALGRPAAGKTGTTNDYEDAWFVGYTPEMVAGVWVGFDEKRPLGKGETGGKVAAPIWTDFMKEALEGHPVNDFPMPDGITFAHINAATGKRATTIGRGAVLELFAKGTEPQLPNDSQSVTSIVATGPNAPSPIGIPAPEPPPPPEPQIVIAPSLSSPTDTSAAPLDEEYLNDSARPSAYAPYQQPNGQLDSMDSEPIFDDDNKTTDSYDGGEETSRGAATDVGASVGAPLLPDSERDLEPADEGY